jgi:hypothetical protein
MTLPSLLGGVPWAGRDTEPPVHQTSAVCGFTEEELGAFPIRTVLEALDCTLPGLLSQSTATGTAQETKASLRLPPTCNLVGVGRDAAWVEDVIQLFLNSLEIKQLNECDGWKRIEHDLNFLFWSSLF